MNTHFKSKWNAQTNTWVAVSELASSAGKTSGLVSIPSKSRLINTGKLCSVVLTAFMTLPTFAIDCHRTGSAPGAVEALVGSAGNDEFLCNSGDFVGFDGLGGADNLSLGAGDGPLTINGDITFGNDASSLYIRQSSNFSNTIINSNITMGSSDDYIAVISTTNNLDFNANVNLGDGNDQLDAEGFVTVTKDIHAGAGNDVLNFIPWNNVGTVTINSDLYAEDGNDNITFLNSIINGKIFGGSGEDTITIENSSIGNNFEIDGGNNEDHLLFYSTATIAGENIKNIEVLKIGRTSVDAPINTLTLTGSQLNLLAPGSAVDQLYIDKDSTLKFDTTAFTINLNGGPGIQNHGIIDLRNSVHATSLTINGNYEGTLGSKLLFNTALGNDASLTDKIIINGNTSGQSAILVTNKGGTGAQTVNGITLVEISGNSDATFTLGAPVQVGSYEYFLNKVGKNWALKSQKTDNNVTPTPTPSPTTSSVASSRSVSSTPAPIYRPGVAGYLQAAQAQFDQSAQVLGRYDQRQEKIARNNDIWGRLIANQTNYKTDSFGYDQSNQNLQFGKNIWANDSNNAAGITLGFGFQSASYKDKNRAFTKAGENTGNSKTSQYHLGAYYSQQNTDNQYLDLQTQLTSSTTKFNDVYDTSAKQSGLGVAVSAEVGKSFALGDSGFDITPQAQFIYQNTSYKAFNDSVSSVGKQTAESLRVRAGASLKPSKATSTEGKLNWYTSLNVWQEVLDTPTRTVAGNEVKSNSSQKPWLELGLGLTQKLNEASSLNAQVNLQNSLSGNQKTGASIHLAYQLKW